MPHDCKNVLLPNPHIQSEIAITNTLSREKSKYHNAFHIFINMPYPQKNIRFLELFFNFGMTLQPKTYGKIY